MIAVRKEISHTYRMERKRRRKMPDVFCDVDIFESYERDLLFHGFKSTSEAMRFLELVKNCLLEIKDAFQLHWEDGKGDLLSGMLTYLKWDFMDDEYFIELLFDPRLPESIIIKAYEEIKRRVPATYVEYRGEFSEKVREFALKEAFGIEDENEDS